VAFVSLPRIIVILCERRTERVVCSALCTHEQPAPYTHEPSTQAVQCYASGRGADARMQYICR
jgi:hypothetical protein